MMFVAFSMLAAAPGAVVAYNPNQPSPGKLDKAVAAAVERAGYRVRLVSSGQLEQIPEGTRLLVLTDARNLPARLAGPVDAFLKAKGRLIALQAPAWQNPLYLVDSKWIGAEQFGLSQAKKRPERPILSLQNGPLKEWERSSNDLAGAASYTVEPCELGDGVAAIHAKIENLTSWDTVLSPALDRPFASGMEVTQFAAKGGPQTGSMVVEWREKDGSRWIASVPLAKSWRLYRLGPGAFRYWPSNPSRGFPGDGFKPANAERFSVGVALSHNFLPTGRHEFWIANVGASRAKPGEPADAMALPIEPTDGLYPHYKFFEVTVPVRAADPADGKTVLESARAYSVQPRPEPNGFDKRREWAFEPLLVARDRSNGEWRGLPAAMVRWSGGPRKGAGLAAFGLSGAAAYLKQPVLDTIERAARRLGEDVWLVDAGTDKFTQFPGEPVRAGATVYADAGAVCRVTVLKDGRPLRSGELALSTGQTAVFEAGEQPAEPGVYRTELRVGGRLVEAREQRQNVYSRPRTKAFVTVEGARFAREGKPLRFNGVNYMPSSGIGTTDWEYFENWMDRRSYDPEIVGRDLRKIKSLGLNAVSVFIYDRAVEAGNLLDLLRQCRELGLLVNLSLRPGTPMDFNWSGVRKIIEAYRLKDEDIVFAYDLAWEPSMGNHRDRKRYDGLWRHWTASVHGSLEAAEAKWGFKMPVEDGQPTNPPDQLLVADGPWRAMVADYRRFVNDLLFLHYNEARDKVRSIDPNHLVSFRMSEAGNPTFNWDAFMPYPLEGIAWATDFLAPEAYGRIGDWEHVKHGIFEVAYCRSLPPHRPVVWAEAGVSSLDASRLVHDPELVKRQGRLYRDLYRMFLESDSDGVFWWWYPGGVRVGENSDYGIVNPDGTDRPSTKAIREFGPKLLALKPPARPERVLEYALDEDARGLYGAYQRLKDEFWRLTEAGYAVKLKSKRDWAAQDPAASRDALESIYRRLGLKPPSP